MIPDHVELELDIRTLARLGNSGGVGDARGRARRPLRRGARSSSCARTSPPPRPPTHRFGLRSSGRASEAYPGSRLVPYLTVGATDARIFRRLGTVAYGFGLFSERLGFENYSTMFHGVDERVDVDSLALSAELWGRLTRDTLAG